MIVIRKYIKREAYYLTNVERKKAKNWASTAFPQILIDPTGPERGQKEADMKGILPTASFMPDIRQALKFETLESAERCMMENAEVLRECSIIMG